MFHGRYTVSTIKKHHDGSSVIELAHTPPAEPGPDDELAPGQRPRDPNRPAPQFLKGRFDMHVSGPEADTYKVGQVYELALGKEGEFSRQRRDDGDDDRSDAQKSADAKASKVR